MILRVDTHPSARIAAFETTFPNPLGQMPSPAHLVALLSLQANAAMQRDESVRTSIRDVLRHGGYKPTGRGKPASEYLVRAAEQDALRSINVAVDVCNVVSLHSGFPVSVVDAEKLVQPLHIGLAASDQTYVFNPGGQVIDVSGLLCLHDAEGPCANAVKDAMRTKTNDQSTRTLNIIWGAEALRARLDHALEWYRQLLADLGAQTQMVDAHETPAPDG